jgi:putative oxidoreductase
MKQLAKYSDHAYALLRIVAGFMFSIHGAQKIFGLLAESQPPVGSQLWFGGLIELVGGILVMVGFQTRWAAFVTSGTMAVAYFQFHWKFQFGPEFFPVVNRGELAALYAFVFLYIACRGGVMWCLDRPDTSE